MKTIEEIRTIKSATLAEFASAAELEIINTPVREGCVMELDAARVFEELAAAHDQSVRALGNDNGWKLTGLQAAVEIAIARCWEPNDDYEEVADLVDKA